MIPHSRASRSHPTAVRGKVVTAAEAVSRIPNGATVGIQGAGGGPGEPTAVLRAIRARFDVDAVPTGLTLVHATGLGDKKEIGTDLLAIQGLVACDIAGHLAMAPKMGAMILRNEIECYNWPQGVISHLFRAIAGRTPGVLTKTGLHTYIDPRLEGGRMNSRTTKDRVEVVNFAGGEWLFFPSMRIDVALVRGTTADLKGNISAETEGAIYEGISLAQAARASGGIVIAQVKRLAEPGTLNPREVVIPGVSVDYVVVDSSQQQSCMAEYDPSLCGDVRIPMGTLPRLPLDARKVIARRAACELFPGAAINVGVGIPDGIAQVAAEDGTLDQFTFTIEQGLVGGIPAGGLIFGVSHNPEARIHQSHQFDYYDGGGLDLAFLGMAQADAGGSVNSSKVGSMLSGCGGSINISQNSKKVVFCGTFTARDSELEVGNGRLAIRREGSIRKFVQRVEQVTFSGPYAANRNQPVLYVTERAVFERIADGMLLREIAPGIDLERDVFAQMDFRPLIPRDLKLMDAALFR
jgi:propionate CoA-transferase